MIRLYQTWPALVTKLCDVTYQTACPCLKVTDGIFMGAAAVMVIAAGRRLERAASPTKAGISILIDTAAGTPFLAREVLVAFGRGLDRGGWRRSRFWRVLSCLDGVWRLYGYTTLACGNVGRISLQPDIAIFSPVFAPGIPHNPVIYTTFCTISNSNNTVIEIGSTTSSEDTLNHA